MKQINRITTTYTADVSGVCSALYELGGMTVMHDPSGCNSTYNTHDEPRWYDMPSLIFISGLTEMDAVLGSDEKFISDVCRAAEELRPRFITICGSPIPMMSGFDYPAVARVIEKRSGVPTISVITNGAHAYVKGAGDAMRAFAGKFLTEKGEKIKNGVNLLGATPLDFSVNSSLNSLKKSVTDHGFELVSCWAMGNTFDELLQAPRAEVNLVVSGVGLECAKLMERKFGIPYIAVLPVREIENEVYSALHEAVQTGKNAVLSAKRKCKDADIVIIGESVVFGSVAMAIEKKYGAPVRLVCPIEEDGITLADGDVVEIYEDAIVEALKGAKTVIADPMFKPVIPEGIEYYPLAHEACSGRIYRKDIPDLIDILREK